LKPRGARLGNLELAPHRRAKSRSDAMKTLVCCAVIVLVISCGGALAGDCCQHCGCQCECNKVCRLVPDTKKVPKVTYSCECEDFCVPGPSQHCVVRDECGCKKHVYTPTCGCVRTRTKLVKHEEMKTVQTHKCVVEYLCPACAAKCPCDPAAAAAMSEQGTQQTSWLASLNLPWRRNASANADDAGDVTSAP
jgi:hypothetical protein